MKNPSRLILSSQALLRYQVVSQVEARVLAGMPLAAAIREVLALPHVDLQGTGCRCPSARSIVGPRPTRTAG